MKNKIIGIIMLLTLFVISGCGGGGSKGYEAEKTQIAQALSGFEAAVEVYEVDDMLAVFDDTDTSKEDMLIIEEGSSEFKKSFTTLENELNEDEKNQKDWRKTTGENSHSYQLDMQMGSYTYSKMSQTGGFASQTFEVLETAEGFGKWLTTDTGTINWELALITGKWKVVSMTIIFNSEVPTASEVKMLGSASAGSGGFGFGKEYLKFK